MTRTVCLCPHCKQPMKTDGDWDECETCHVGYVYGELNGHHIKWEREIGAWAIALNLYPDVNRTVLTAFNTTYGLNQDDIYDESGHTEIKLDHCMTNVTPENCLDKIKLLLVWQ